jgi:hypothetical protein
MRSKRDIIEKGTFYNDVKDSMAEKRIYKCMDEYAKQVAMQYAEHIIGKLRVESSVLTENDKFCMKFPAWNENLYNSFISNQLSNTKV